MEDWIGRQNRVRWLKPDGAFYGFLHVDGLKDSLRFCQDMVRTTKSASRRAGPSAWAIRATILICASASPRMRAAGGGAGAAGRRDTQVVRLRAEILTPLEQERRTCVRSEVHSSEGATYTAPGLTRPYMDGRLKGGHDRELNCFHRRSRPATPQSRLRKVAFTAMRFLSSISTSSPAAPGTTIFTSPLPGCDNSAASAPRDAASESRTTMPSPACGRRLVQIQDRWRRAVSAHRRPIRRWP